MVRRAAAAAAILLAVACGRGERPASARPPSAAATAAPSEPAVDTEDVADRTRRAPGARPPVIWLGFDGFDWELLDRLVSDGRMPNWKYEPLSVPSALPTIS